MTPFFFLFQYLYVKEKKNLIRLLCHEEQRDQRFSTTKTPTKCYQIKEVQVIAIMIASVLCV